MLDKISDIASTSLARLPPHPDVHPIRVQVFYIDHQHLTVYSRVRVSIRQVSQLCVVPSQGVHHDTELEPSFNPPTPSMPSHLHPRSRMTTSLFGTTLLVSFLVVGMPHILPCPAPRTQFADNGITVDGKSRRRRRSSKQTEQVEAGNSSEVQVLKQEQAMAEEQWDALKRKAHECPVPKPGGRIGEILGFPKKDEAAAKSSEVQIEPRADSG
ncbi:MAG: hypothetical protein Q9166_002521 [cf. Caloplaca sp. 2 TL-2023]